MACHHAWFMAKAIYYLTLDLLLPQLQTLAPHLVSAMVAVVVRKMGEFISVFYTTWFIKAPLAGTAPSQVLQAIDDMIQYIYRSPNSTKACLNSMQNHFWYLTERFVVLCLINDDLLEDVRQAVALQLYKAPRLEMPYSYKLGKAMPQIVVDGHTKPLSELK